MIEFTCFSLEVTSDSIHEVFFFTLLLCLVMIPLLYCLHFPSACTEYVCRLQHWRMRNYRSWGIEVILAHERSSWYHLNSGASVVLRDTIGTLFVV